MAVTTASFSDLSTDASLAPFLSTSFSPVDYLNSTLPSWTPNAQSTIPSTSTSSVSSASLAEITAQTQAAITQLNAQLTRLSANLTGLTDDILRAGGRLAYEVELLRGDAGSLANAVTERLSPHVAQFVPDEADANTPPTQKSQVTTAVTRLHMLTLVRERLDAVVKVFGDAMAWPVAPSEVSVKASFISVSGPDDGAEAQTREKQAKAYTDKLRADISELLSTGTDEGELAALRRLESLRVLATVWKGTSEEKARLKIIESLAKLVEDRKRAGAAPGRSGYGLGTELPQRSAPGRRY